MDRTIGPAHDDRELSNMSNRPHYKTGALVTIRKSTDPKLAHLIGKPVLVTDTADTIPPNWIEVEYEGKLHMVPLDQCELAGQPPKK